MSKTGLVREAAASWDFVEIHPMTEHDLLEVVEIEETCGLSRWGWEAYYGELARAGESLMFVARLDDASIKADEKSIAGFIATRISGDELHVNNFAVRHSFRRRGLGRALLSRALKEGAQRGARQALLEVRVTNKVAQALYAREGFRIAGRRRNYYTSPQEDAYVMSMSLRDLPP